jgi:aerobic carbon-monoxide dehydrogenase large subunit
MAGSLLGTEVRRVEDPDLLTGNTTYVANLHFPEELHVEFVRSPFAHALITSVDSSDARAVEGVVAVYTGTDLDLGGLPRGLEINKACRQQPLPPDRVRFAGEAVVAVVAETPQAAADGAALVDVDYEPLPAAVDPEEALEPDAPLQFPELGSNIAGGLRDPEGAEVLGDAEVVVRARIENQRVAVAPMEGNAIAAVPGASASPGETVPRGDGGAEHDMTVYLSTQFPHTVRGAIATVFGYDEDRVRVVAPHVGGGFGGKAGLAPEHAVAVEAARRLGRPVRWAETRSSNLQSMPHGRGQVQYAELGLRRDGTITGLRCRVLGECGAYAGVAGGFAFTLTQWMAQGVYRIPRISWSGLAAMTNTTPTGAFRGAGRPEAAAMLERLMDLGAAELALDPAEMRRRNFIAPDAFPYTTVTGMSYDSGEYDKALTRALEVAGYEELRREQARRIEAGETRLLGVGLSCYVEITAIGGAGDYAALDVDTDGGVTVRVGTSGHGQGHATAFSTIASDELGVPLESVRFVQSDTAQVPRGWGTAGSRSLQVAGSAVHVAAGRLIERARRLAATVLEADEGDVRLSDEGRFHVAGVPEVSVSWAQVAAAAQEAGERLADEVDFAPEGATFPFGAHVSVVEVDTGTGFVRPLRHIAVDDCGRVVNPMLVRGQQHGGVVQGVAQALWEHVRFDEDGNPVTSTFADYHLASAVDVPDIVTDGTVTPTDRNPLGAKGIGESATVGSTPAVQNAVVDALRHLGVRHVDIPCTPERVWRAIQQARTEGGVPAPWNEPPKAFDTLPVRN